MTVSEHDQLGRPLGKGVVLVTSRSGEEPYRVDLGSFKRNGKCDCKSFQTVFWPRIREAKRDGTFKPGDHFRCPHIVFARRKMFEKWGDQIIAELTKDNDYSQEEN